MAAVPTKNDPPQNDAPTDLRARLLAIASELEIIRAQTETAIGQLRGLLDLAGADPEEVAPGR